MENKTFLQLQLGDIFYMVYTNYEGKEKPRYQTVEVKKIEISEKQNLIINDRDGYHNRNNDFLHQALACKVSVIETEKGFFTTDYNKVVEGLKKAALGYIKEYEGEIQSANKRIEETRKAYWEYLNATTKTPLKKHKK